MGGLGKTTLAKSVYNNQKIHDHFKKKIWVCVSEKSEVLELFNLILGSLRGSRVKLSSRDVVVQNIIKELEGKIYLLVLDDVWNEIPEMWNDFFCSLEGISAAHGSRCLVTTRSQNVASIVSRHHSFHVLGKLSDDGCWSIIKQRAVQSGEIPEELTLMREQLIKRCDGLPLAANVIGGLLHLQGKEEWQSIVENRLLLNSSEDPKDSIMQILKLSFDYLSSPSIKRCFAYCSLFSKDEEIDRDLLIELWMAEGFLQADHQNEILMEEIGSKYLNVLVQSSLLEKGDRRWGKYYYKMHDLVHDLAQSISKPQSFNSENDVMNNSTHQVRYLALDTSAEIMRLNYASALILKRSSISNEMLWKFKGLHILNLSKVQIVELPSSIGKLKHLRFLALSDSMIKSLPKSICKLYNLQTLRMDDCHRLEALPQGMNNLISLRHLHYYTRTAKFKMPLGMGRLVSLQTLEFFNVGEELGRQIEELGCLKYLKGKLEIRNLELVKGKEGAEGADLSGKQNLRELKFCWSSEDREAVETYDENVLEGLEPHQNLEVLTIENFMGYRFPQWLANLSNLSKLVKLTLQGCNKCTELPTLGHLPCLEYLWLKMENVSRIGSSFYGLDDCRGGGFGSTSSFGDGQVAMPRKKLFPALKYLELVGMTSLIEWEEAALVDNDVAVFPALEELKIYSCSQLTSTPTHFPSLKSLTISGAVQVSVVKNILSKVNSTLKFLTLMDLEWTELPEDVYQLPSLVELGIWGCPEILHVGRTRTANIHLPSLETFRVNDCKGLISIARETLEGCTSLSTLVVVDCPNLRSFPLDLQQTPSVSFISLINCPKLFTDKNGMPRGFGHLTSLSSLRIGPFYDYSKEFFDWSGLMSCSSTLRHLGLYGMRDVESILPDEFQHFTTLPSLELHGFKKIEALPDWFGNLASLEILELRYCEKLRYLPSMPAMRRLNKLRTLRICDCPLLEKRCSSNSGPDSEWSKISHIPDFSCY